jgi:hypothetical protein
MRNRHDDVSMCEPRFDDFASLDVPFEDFVVFTSGDEVATGGGKDGGDAEPVERTKSVIDETNEFMAVDPTWSEGRRQVGELWRKALRNVNALSVGVPRVRFGDLVRLVVPQTNGRVEGRCEEKLGVGREADVRAENRKREISDELKRAEKRMRRTEVCCPRLRVFEDTGRSRYPKSGWKRRKAVSDEGRFTRRRNTHVAVPGSRHEQRSVGTELNGGNGFRVSGKHPHAATCGKRRMSSVRTAKKAEGERRTFLHIPHPDGLVHSSTRNQVPPRTPSNAENGAQMPLQYPDRTLRRRSLLPVVNETLQPYRWRCRRRRNLPYPNRFVVGSGGEEFRVGGEGDVWYAGSVGVEGTGKGEGGKGVKVYRRVGGCRTSREGMRKKVNSRIIDRRESNLQAETIQAPFALNLTDETDFLCPVRVNRKL